MHDFVLDVAAQRLLTEYSISRQRQHLCAIRAYFEQTLSDRSSQLYSALEKCDVNRIYRFPLDQGDVPGAPVLLRCVSCDTEAERETFEYQITMWSLVNEKMSWSIFPNLVWSDIVGNKGFILHDREPIGLFTRFDTMVNEVDPQDRPFQQKVVLTTLLNVLFMTYVTLALEYKATFTFEMKNLKFINIPQKYTFPMCSSWTDQTCESNTWLTYNSWFTILITYFEFKPLDLMSTLQSEMDKYYSKNLSSKKRNASDEFVPFVMAEMQDKTVEIIQTISSQYSDLESAFLDVVELTNLNVDVSDKDVVDIIQNSVFTNWLKQFTDYQSVQDFEVVFQTKLENNTFPESVDVPFQHIQNESSPNWISIQYLLRVFYSKTMLRQQQFKANHDITASQNLQQLMIDLCISWTRIQFLKREKDMSYPGIEDTKQTLLQDYLEIQTVALPIDDLYAKMVRKYEMNLILPCSSWASITTSTASIVATDEVPSELLTTNLLIDLPTADLPTELVEADLGAELSTAELPTAELPTELVDLFEKKDVSTADIIAKLVEAEEADLSDKSAKSAENVSDESTANLSEESIESLLMSAFAEEPTVAQADERASQTMRRRNVPGRRGSTPFIRRGSEFAIGQTPATQREFTAKLKSTQNRPQSYLPESLDKQNVSLLADARSALKPTNKYLPRV